MGRLTAGMTVRVIGTRDVGSLVLVREAAQTCVIKLTRDGTLKKNVPLDDVEEAAEDDVPVQHSPIRLAATNQPLALPPSMGGPSSPTHKQSGGKPNLQVGDQVKAQYKKGAKWFRGIITRVRSDGTYDVEYEDGDVESKVQRQYIEAAVDKTAASPTKTTRYAVGERVKARYKKGVKWFKGKITKAHSDGTYDVRYEDGDVETRVDANFLQREEEKEEVETLSPTKTKSQQNSNPQVGDNVKARYKKGLKSYSAVITRVQKDGTYDLKYEDGDTESSVEAAYIEFVKRNDVVDEKKETKRSKSFRVGDPVRASYNGGTKRYPGRITRVRSDGTYDVTFEDGEVETRVEKDLIEDAAKETSVKLSSPKTALSSSRLSVGDAIKARYKGGTTSFPGKVTKVRADGAYDIKYDDGEVETGVEARHIESIEVVPTDDDLDFAVGDRVHAKYKNGAAFFPGKIVKVHATGSYDVRYDDGETETRVKREQIKRATANPSSPSKPSFNKRAESPRVGDAVKARYKKGTKFYAGKIARVRTDGTFDIEYEDGDVELKVEADHVEFSELLKKPPSPQKKRGFDVGDTIMARYKKGDKLFRGKIKRVRADNTYDITYDDGDVETAVALEYIEPHISSTQEDSPRNADPTFEVGDHVKATYKNSTKSYPARVSRVRTDGTYDIDGDDGEKETRVEGSRMELTTKRVSTNAKKTKDLAVGDRVKAFYKGGKKQFDAVIARVRTDGTYDVKYDDGDTESRVAAALIETSETKRELRVGDHVVATHKAGKKRIRGVIIRIRSTGTCDIRYRDKTEEQQVSMNKVELEEDERGGKHRDSEAEEEDRLIAGDAVQAYYKKGKKLYAGKITRRHADDNTYDIRYDDGEVENRISRHLIVSASNKIGSKKDDPLSITLREGDVVMAKHKKSNKRVRGKISRARTDGTFDIDFDDGEIATRVEMDLMEKVVDAPDEMQDRNREHFKAGDKVKARYKKGSKWFPGTIVKARTDDSYDIEYEDGDMERSVASELIEAMDTKTKFKSGDAVSARYKNGVKWYAGIVKKVRPDGTFDVRYEDGDLEERVKPENIRATETPRESADARRSPRKKAVRFEKGDTVEADYKGKGRFRKAIVLRVHSDDTVDVEYDNGDVEKRASLASVRAVDEREHERGSRPGKRRGSDSENETRTTKPRRKDAASSAADSDSDSNRFTKPSATKKKKLAKGTRVTMRRALDAAARRIGRVKKTHADGRCDVAYKNGDVTKRISQESLLICSDGESSEEENAKHKTSHCFKRDQAIMACWRRATRMARPSIVDHWEDATILSMGDHNSYSIRYHNGDMEEDVPEEAIKNRPEPVVARRHDAPPDGGRELSDVDVGFLLEQLALTLFEEGKLSKKPRVCVANESHSSSSSNSESSGSGSDGSSPKSKRRSRARQLDPIEKALHRLFDRQCLQRYQARFDQHDTQDTTRISKSKIIDVVEDLCASESNSGSTKPIDTTTVRKHLSEWFSTQDTLRTHTKFDFKTFMIALAVARHHLSKRTIQQTMAHALEARFASHHESKKQLELWQHKLGFRTFETLQRFFHDAALPRMYPAHVRVREIASIFDQVTRSAIPNKPLEVYLQQMQLHAHHTLQLAEFMCCYYQLYGSADTNRTPAWTEQLELRPVAFVASCLFSNGDPCCHRPGDLVRRLCIGRTPGQVDLIMKFREVFESLQAQDGSDSDATILTSQLNAFASKVVSDPSVLEQSIIALRKRTASVSLVEIFSMCGFVIDELTAAPTVVNAIDKLRLRSETADVRRMVGVVRTMCLKVLRFPHNPDYWRLRSDSAAFHHKLGRFDGATSLLEAVGFLEYGKAHFELRGARTPDGKRSSCLPKSTLDTLREKCAELDAELSVMDGVESVVSILQRIATQREHDTPLSLDECGEILTHLVAYVDTILKNPKDSRCWRIRESNQTFQRQIGYVPCCADLMASIGYDLASSTQGNVYVLRGTGLSKDGGGVNIKVDASLANFAFSSVSPHMEWFLWRRKQEMASLLQDNMEYLVQMLSSSTSVSTRQSPLFRQSAGTPATQSTGKMYPYGRNAVDIFSQTASQKSQLTMIRTLFDALDTKQRGYLGPDDFGGDAKVIPHWASFEMFDIDHDGRVDVADFVGALGPCLDYSFDPLSNSDFVPFQRMTLSEQVSTLVGRLRLGVGLVEAINVVNSIIQLLVRILDEPSKREVRTIPDKAAIVTQATRVQPVKELLQLIGYRAFEGSAIATAPAAEAGIAFVLQPHQHVRFQTSKTAPVEAAELNPQTLSRLQLIAAMLGGHGRVMHFPTVSDVGAFARALTEMRPMPAWIKLLELVDMCLENILTHPHDEDRYRQLKTTTTTFHSVVTTVGGGIQLFLAIGFRETDRGTLVLPDNIGHSEIQARKLEVSVGCQALRIVEKLSALRDVDDAFPQPVSIGQPVSAGNTKGSDSAVEYYKRKALAAEMAREEALRKSAQLEKQLESVAKTQLRRSLNGASMTLSTTSRSVVPPKSAARNQRTTTLGGTATAVHSIEAEILAEFSPRKQAFQAQDGRAFPLTHTRAQSTRGGWDTRGRTSQQPRSAKAVQRRNPSAPSSSTMRTPSPLNESALAMDADAGSRTIVLKSSDIDTYLQKGALIRIGTENGDLTEERLIVSVDSTTTPALVTAVVHSALQFPHFARDLVFVLPSTSVDCGRRLAFAEAADFIQNNVLDGILERVIAMETLELPTTSIADYMPSSVSSLTLARTMRLAEGATVVHNGICGEHLIIATSSTFANKQTSSSDTLQFARDHVTARKLRAVWDGLLLEFGGKKVDQIAWRHLHSVTKRIPWLAMYKTEATARANIKGSTSWSDFVKWLQFPALDPKSDIREEEETPDQLLALTILRQPFRALVSTSRDENGVFHTVPIDEFIKLASASLVSTLKATDAHDIAATHRMLDELQKMVQSQGCHVVTWPEIVYFVRHRLALHHTEVFLDVVTSARSDEDATTSRRIAAVVGSATNDVVFVLRFDGLVEVWRSTSTGSKELVSTSLVLFYTGASGGAKPSKANKPLSLMEDQLGVIAHGVRNSEWRDLQRQHVATAVDAFVRCTTQRRTLLSLTAHDSCLVVNATMLSDSDRPHSCGLLFYHVGLISDVSLRPLWRLSLEDSQRTLKRTDKGTSQVVSSRGVIECFACSADGTTVAFQNVGTATRVLWIASTSSGQIVACVDEFAWVPDAALLFTTAAEGRRSLVGVASTRTAYVSVWRLEAGKEKKMLSCVLSSQALSTASKSPTVSAVAMTRKFVFATLENGKIAAWMLAQSQWNVSEARMPPLLIQQTFVSIHQLTLVCNGFRALCRESKPLRSLLTVPEDEDTELHQWDQTLSDRCVRFALYLLENGDVIDVAIADTFATHMVTLDVVSCIAHTSDLLSVPGFDQLLLQPGAVVRLVFVACEYRRDGVFAQKSMRELLSDIKSQRVLHQTRNGMELFTMAYEESVGLQLRCYYRHGDSGECAVTTPWTRIDSEEHQTMNDVTVGIVGSIAATKRQAVLQLWHFSAVATLRSDHAHGDDTSKRAVWEFEAFRIRRQRVILERMQTHRRIYLQRQTLYRDLQKLLATAFQSGYDGGAKEKLAEAVLVKVEQLCWLTAVESRCDGDPVENHVRQLLRETPMSATELADALQDATTRSPAFRPWSRRLHATLRRESNSNVALADAILLIRQWRRDYMSIESLCEVVGTLGILDHLLRHDPHRPSDAERDAVARVLITQQFTAFALSQQTHDGDERSKDADTNYHTLLTFIPPRLAAAFLLRVCDVGDRLDKCVDVIADRTTSAKMTDPLEGGNPEQMYARLLLRKRVRDRIERIEQRHTGLQVTAVLRSLESLVSNAAAQHLYRVLKTAPPSVTPTVTSISLCVPAVLRRLGTRRVVDAEGVGATGSEKISLAIILVEDEPPTPQRLRCLQTEIAFYRRVQSWKTRELFLPVVPSATNLSLFRSEYLPGIETSHILTCESLRGWLTLADCLRCLGDAEVDCSITHWQSMVAFWCRRVLLGLVVLEDNGVRLRSLSLEDVIVSPDAQHVRFVRLDLCDDKQNDSEDVDASDHIILFGRFVLRLHETFGGDGSASVGTENDDTLKQLQQRLMELWSSNTDGVDKHPIEELLKHLQQQQSPSSPESSIQRIMTATLLTLQSKASSYHPTSFRVLCCIAFADMDEEPPESLAAQLSYIVSIHTKALIAVLEPLTYIAHEPVDPSRSASLLQNTVHKFNTILSRTIRLTSLQATWAMPVKRTMLRWLARRQVIERIVSTSISLFEKCLRTAEREAANSVLHAALDMIRTTLDLVETTETLWTLQNEPTTQQLVFHCVRGLCVLCGATPMQKAPAEQPSPVIAAALWRLSEASLRELIGSSTTKSPGTQPERYPTVVQLLRSLRSSLANSISVEIESPVRPASTAASRSPPTLALWWCHQSEDSLPQRLPPTVNVGDHNSNVCFDSLVVVYQTLDLRFNASRVATSSAAKFRLAALQSWFASPYLDRKSCAPLAIVHDLPARVWHQLSVASTLSDLLCDPDGRIVFGSLSIVEVYTRVLRYHPLQAETHTLSSSVEHQIYEESSPALQFALDLVRNPHVLTNVTHLLSHLVRTLKLQGEAATSAAISNRYSASGRRVADPVALLSVVLGFLVNCLHAGDRSTRHWITTGLSALILSQAKANTLAFVRIVDVNWIHHSAPTGKPSSRQRVGDASPAQWSVFTMAPAGQKVSPFELLVHELVFHTASRNTLLLQQLGAKSAPFRQLLESFGTAASASAHLILSQAFGSLSHVWEVVRDVAENDGTLDEKSQGIEYATASIAVWVSSRQRTDSLLPVLEKTCATVWSWLIQSWRSVLSIESSDASLAAITRHGAVVIAGLRLAHAIAVHNSITIEELQQLTTIRNDHTMTEEEATVFAAVLSLLNRTTLLDRPSTLVSSLFRAGVEITTSLVGENSSIDDRPRTLALLKHGFCVAGVVGLLRTDTTELVRCSGASLQYAIRMKTRLWSAVLHHGDGAVVQAIIDDELISDWLSRLLDGDLPLQSNDDNAGDTALHDAATVVNSRLEVLMQLELLLHAYHALDFRSSRAMQLLVRDLLQSVLGHRTIQLEKQRALTYAQFVRRHKLHPALRTSLASRMVATAKRFVQLVCCLSVDMTAGDLHSTVLAVLTRVGVSRDVVDWHQCSESTSEAGCPCRSQWVSEFWEMWPEGSARLGVQQQRCASHDREPLVASARPPRSELGQFTEPVLESILKQEAQSEHPLKRVHDLRRSSTTASSLVCQEATSPTSIPLDEVLHSLDSEITTLESIFHRHAVSSNQKSSTREKLMPPDRLPTALGECNLTLRVPTSPTTSSPLSFSAFLLAFARHSGLDALWHQSCGQHLEFVWLSCGRWASMPMAHWTLLQRRMSTVPALSTDHVVEVLLSLHRGLFARHELSSLIESTLRSAPPKSWTLAQLRRVAAAVYEEAANCPAVQRPVLQISAAEGVTSLRRVGTVPVSPVRMETQSPRQPEGKRGGGGGGGEGEGEDMPRQSVVQTLLSIDLDSAKALENNSAREELRRKRQKTRRRVEARGGEEEASERADENAEDSLGSDAYSPFSQLLSTSEDERSKQERTKMLTAERKKKKKKSYRRADTKTLHSSSGEEEKKKVAAKVMWIALRGPPPPPLRRREEDPNPIAPSVPVPALHLVALAVGGNPVAVLWPHGQVLALEWARPQPRGRNPLVWTTRPQRYAKYFPSTTQTQTARLGLRICDV